MKAPEQIWSKTMSTLSMTALGAAPYLESAGETLDTDLAARLRARALQQEIEVSVLFASAWAVVLSFTSGEDNVRFDFAMERREEAMLGAEDRPHLKQVSHITVAANGCSISEMTAEVWRQFQHTRDANIEDMTGSTVPGAGLAQQARTILAYWRCPSESAVEGCCPYARDKTLELMASYSSVLAVCESDKMCITLYADRRVGAGRMLRYVTLALRHIVKGQLSDSALSLSIMTNYESQQMNVEALAHRLFEDQVVRSPDALAILAEGRSITYRQLNAQANRLARYLRALGVGPDQFVALLIGPCIEMVIGMLAVLKAGGAYVPLDPNQPSKRLATLLKDIDPKVLLTTSGVTARLPRFDIHTLALDGLPAAIQRECCDDISNLEVGLAPNHLAYVIFTSGSTGRPKGVLVEHGGLSNYLQWALQIYAPESGGFIPVNSPLSFDATVTSLYCSLLSGCVTVLFGSGREIDGLTELILKDAKISLIKISPAHLQLLGEHLQGKRKSWRLGVVVIGGEALPARTVRLWRSLCPDVRLINEYGPTEAVVGCCTYEIPRIWNADERVPIGRPIANTHIYILNELMTAVPVGVIGEIFIAGTGVARGYLNRPVLSAERFVADPFQSDGAGRMYRTGDLGQWRADGTIEYFGRNDDQLKIRGIRVEPGEIEHQLCQCDGVKNAIVLAHEVREGDKQLVAYVVPKEESGTEILNIGMLRKTLSTLLPDFLVPRTIVLLDAIPLNENGKVDRRAMPVPELDARVDAPYEAPIGREEQVIAGIWEEVLGVECVGRHDSFFELGGHSLLAMKALSKVSASLKRPLRLIDIYQNPTPKELAAMLTGGGETEEPLVLALEASMADVAVCATYRSSPPKTVLVTGATGFVGRFLLSQLLAEKGTKAYCLVRAASREDARTRLMQGLQTWGLWAPDADERLVAVPGDLKTPMFGLQDEEREFLLGEVDAIYHCAASVNHLETYAIAKTVNVAAVKDLLAFCSTGRPKTINYVSTLRIFSTRGERSPRAVHEGSPIEYEKHFGAQGYEASKWVAEKILMNAANDKGYGVNIFRLGLVWADTTLGRYDERQAEYRILNSALRSGFGIQDYRFALEPVPVDYVAKAIVSLASRNSGSNRVFHIGGSSEGKTGLFERCNAVSGLSLTLVPYNNWIIQIKRLHMSGRDLPVVPLIDGAFSMADSSLATALHEPETHEIKFYDEVTRAELELVGLSAPVLDDHILRMTLRDMCVRDAELTRSGVSAKIPG